MKPRIVETDYLIIGSGLAGLFAAYHASKYGSVTVITKADYRISSSWYAQGGIAAALSSHDSTQLHYIDTITAGRGLCDEKAVRILVEEGKDAVKELINIGMEFDREGSELLFGLEGGHSQRRVLHAGGSATGQQVVEFLVDVIKDIPNVTFEFNTQALKLIRKENRILGVHALNLNDLSGLTVYAANVIMTSGGYGRVYSRSTNPDSAIGEGIWLAKNAGVEIRDMEFIQFHPTAFYSESGKTFLISEAVRGEGAYLLNSEGKRFMFGYHELGELAPRDVVSKAIYNELKISSSDFVYLDLRHLDARRIKERFANIYAMIEKCGLNMTTDLIPVAPAAHYSIGGIKTDYFGGTNIENLYACGECASTGVHGANRLASNSLLECLVFSKRAVQKTLESSVAVNRYPDTFFDELLIDKEKREDFAGLQIKLAHLLNDKAGIIRSGEKLSEAGNIISSLKTGISNKVEYYNILSSGLLDLAEMIIKAAAERTESRGGHQREDFPLPDKNLLGHFVFDNDNIKFEELDEKGREHTEMGETVN